MNPLDPNTQNNSSVPTSPASNGQGAVNGVPTPVQPGAVFHPPTAADQVSAAQASSGVDGLGAIPGPSPANQAPVTQGVDSPTATSAIPQSEARAQNTEAVSASAADTAGVGTPLGNNSPLHPEVLAKDLWGGGTPPPEAPVEHPKTPWFKSLWFILLAAIFSTGLIAGAFYIFGKPSGDTTINNSQVNENYEVTTVPLSDLASDQIITIDNDSQLAINGQLRINNSAVIEATDEPANPEPGMLWFSRANNTLYYYNGTQFVPMSTSIGGVAGTLSLGGGLSLVNSSIVNSGVISIQGQAGNVDFSAGGGISINGTTITNTGVLGITAGNPGQLSVTSNNGNVTISLAGIQAGGVLVGTAGGGISTVLPANPGLCLISNGSNLPEFGSCTGTTTVTSLNTFSGALTIAAGSGISVTPSGGNTLTIASTAGGVSSLNTGTGALQILNSSRSGQDISINTATTSALGLVSVDGTTVLINGGGELSIGQSVATGASVTFNQLSLSTDLAVSEGGTGASSFSAGGLLVGNGASPIGVVTTATAGQCLLSSTAGSPPVFQNCPVGGNVSQGSSQTQNYLTKWDSVANTITNSIISDNGATATVTGNLTVNSGIFTGNGSGLTNVDADTLQGFTAASFEPAFVTLGVNSGGTGAATLTANGILLGNGTSPISAISPAANGLCLMSTGVSSAPTFQSCPVGGNVSANSGTANYLTKFSANGIDIENSDLLVQSGGLQVTTASYYLDIFNGSNTTFNIQNTNSGGVANLVVDGTVTGTSGLSVGSGKNITSESGGLKVIAGTSASDNITFETRDSLGNLLSFIFPTSGGTGQTICTSGITCASGGGQAVILENGTGSGTAQTSAANRPSIWINRTGGTGEILKLQQGGNDVFVIDSAGAASIPVASGLKLGTSSSVNGQLTFANSTDGQLVNLRTQAPSGVGDVDVLFPVVAGGGSYEVCLNSGNCSGAGGGVTVSSNGTANTIAMFTGAQTIANSIITQPSSSLVDIEGDLQLGTPNSLTGKLVLANSGTANTVTLQSGVSTGNLTFTLPTDDGTPNQCLKTDGSGVLSWTACLSGGGAGGGVTDLNTFSGSVSVVGTANQISVNNSSNTITLSLPQDIATTSTPTFGGLSLTGAGQLTLGNASGQAGVITVRDGSSANYALIQTGGAFSANRTIVVPDRSGTLAVAAGTNIALSADGVISFSGVLPVLNGGTGANSASGARTNLGAAASGANSDITSLTAVTSLQNSTGSLSVGNTGYALTLQGNAATSLTATDTGNTNSLVFATPSGGNKTITIPNETGTICLQSSGSCGFLTSAVTSLQGQTGALNLVAGTGIGISGLTITNDGVTSLAGTTNKISVSAPTGAVTLSVPNDLYLGASGSAAGTLSLFDTDFSNRAILQAANLNADRTYTLPNASGTLAVSASGNIALSAAGDISFTGQLPAANGGTGLNGASASNGQLLIGNGSGYTLATLTQGTGITITNGAGSIEIAAPGSGTCATCANQSLSNLSSTGIADNRLAKLSGNALVSSDISDTGSAITIGDSGDNNQTVIIQGGTNASSAVSLQTLAGGKINIATDNINNTVQIGNTANAATQTINIGNNATTSSVNTVTIGSQTTGSSTILQGGTVGVTVRTGANASGVSGALALSTGTGTTSTGAISVTSGNASAGTAGTVSVDTGTSTSGGGTVSLGSTNARTVNIGNVSATTTTIQGGTAINIGTGNANGNVIQIGNTANAINQNINIGDNTTSGAVSIVKVGSLIGTSMTTLQGGTLGLSAATGTNASGSSGAIQINSGAGTTSTGTITIGTGNASAGSSGALNVSSGTGTTATGALTLISGNASAGTAGNLRVDVGTSTSGSGSVLVGNTNARTVTVGNATSTTTLNLQSGTGGIAASSTATTGTAMSLTANSLTTGSGLSVTSSSASFLSGSQVQVTQNPTYTGNATNDSQLLNVNRSVTLNNPPIDISVNNTTSGSSYFNVGGYVSFNLTGNVTVNSGNNRYLVMSIHNRQSGACVMTSGTFDTSQTLTQIDTYSGNTSGVLMVGLASPNVGTNRPFSINMYCPSGTTWTTYWSAMVFNNVAQTNSYSTPVTKNYLVNPTNIGTVSSTSTSQMVVEGMSPEGGYSANVTESGQVRVLNSGAHGYSSYRPGQTTSTTMGWSGVSANMSQMAIRLNRAPVLNTLSGNVASFSSNCSGSGTCADTSNILNLNQQFSGATGSVLQIQNAGSGDSIQVKSGSTDAFRITNTAGSEGSAVFQNRTDNTAAFRVQGQSSAFIMNADTLNGALSVTSNAFSTAGLLTASQSGIATAGGTISGSTQNVSRSVTAQAQTVVIDSANATQSNGALSWNHTIGSQSNRAVIVAIGGNNNLGSVTSIKFGGAGGTNMTKITAASNTYLALYILPPASVPAAGTYQILISGISANQSYATAATYYNVDSATPYTGGAVTGFGYNPAQTLTSSTTADMAVDAMFGFFGTAPHDPAYTGQTAHFPTYTLGTNKVRSSYRQGTATSTAIGWSTPNDWGANAAVLLKGASATTSIIGSVSSISGNCTQNGGVCADSSNILNLNQQYSGGTGAVLAIQNSGSGADIQLSKGTIQTTATNAVSTNSVGVSIQSGNASGATSNSGNVTIDSGTATGTTGNIFIGNANALTVNIGNTNATIGTWANNSGYNVVVSSVAQPRMGHGSAVSNGYVYVVGGQLDNSVANARSTVYYAKLNSDGSIPTTGVGVWASAGNSLPDERTFHSVVASNGYLYAIGGMDDLGAVRNTVYYAKINSNGTVGTWNTESDTITAVQGHRSFTYNGYVYVVGGSTTAAVTGAVSTVQYARLNADGSTGAWSTTTAIGGSSPVSRYAPGVAVGNGHIYVAGGIDSASTVHSTVYVAKLKSDGTIDSGAYNASSNPGAWRTTNAIVSGGTQARYGLQLIASNGYLYAFGGNSGGGVQSGVYSAPLVNDGSIGTWSTLRSMTLAVNNHQVVAANGYFYTIGGIDGTNAVLNTVYYSSAPRVRVAGNLDLIGTDNVGLAEGGAGGELTAGNTRIVGTFDVSDQANFMQDVKIGGNLVVGGNPTNTNPVFAVQNATGVNAIQVSANNLSLTGINANETVLRVAMDSVTSRSISAAGYISGLAFNTANGDYAEWIPWNGPKPPQGDIIDYNGAKMVVSSLETAAVIANDKFSDGNSLLVAFTGQVDVRVTGAVNAGDYLVDNGDGSAKAISPANSTLSDYVSRIGTALESSAVGGKVLSLIAGPGVNASRFNQQSNSFADLNVSGSLTTQNLVVMGNAVFNGNITVNGRIVTGGGTPLATALSAAGSGATVTIDGNDSAGRITITTGTGTAAGDIGRIDFSEAFDGDARTNLTPMNGSAAELQYYYSSTNANFTLKSNNQLAPNTTYIYSYWVVE